jgi:hypothetical protein
MSFLDVYNYSDISSCGEAWDEGAVKGEVSPRKAFVHRGFSAGVKQMERIVVLLQ